MQEIIKAHDEIMEMVRQTSGTEEEVVARYNARETASMQPATQPMMQQPISSMQQPMPNVQQPMPNVQ